MGDEILGEFPSDGDLKNAHVELRAKYLKMVEEKDRIIGDIFSKASL